MATMATIATMTIMAIVTLAGAFISAPLLAQEPGGPAPQHPGPGGPGGRGDRTFLYAQLLRGLDEKASLLLEQGKLDAAIEEMRRAAGIDIPKESPAYELKTHMVGRFAMALAESGRKKEALETIQKLLADVPPGSVAEASALLDAGMVYMKSGMPDEALKAFDRSIELSQ